MNIKIRAKALINGNLNSCFRPSLCENTEFEYWVEKHRAFTFALASMRDDLAIISEVH